MGKFSKKGPISASYGTGFDGAEGLEPANKELETRAPKPRNKNVKKKEPERKARKAAPFITAPTAHRLAAEK